MTQKPEELNTGKRSQRLTAEETMELIQKNGSLNVVEEPVLEEPTSEEHVESDEKEESEKKNE